MEWNGVKFNVLRLYYQRINIHIGKMNREDNALWSLDLAGEHTSFYDPQLQLVVIV